MSRQSLRVANAMAKAVENDCQHPNMKKVTDSYINKKGETITYPCYKCPDCTTTMSISMWEGIKETKGI